MILSMKHTSPLLRYGVAVLAVEVAFVVKLILDPMIVQNTPFLLVFGAIMVSAWYGGFGPGLFATFAAAIATDYFFLPRRASLQGSAWKPYRFWLSSLKGRWSAF